MLALTSEEPSLCSYPLSRTLCPAFRHGPQGSRTVNVIIYTFKNALSNIPAWASGSRHPIFAVFFCLGHSCLRLTSGALGSVGVNWGSLGPVEAGGCPLMSFGVLWSLVGSLGVPTGFVGFLWVAWGSLGFLWGSVGCLRANWGSCGFHGAR